MARMKQTTRLQQPPASIATIARRRNTPSIFAVRGARPLRVSPAELVRIQRNEENRLFNAACAAVAQVVNSIPAASAPPCAGEPVASAPGIAMSALKDAAVSTLVAMLNRQDGAVLMRSVQQHLC